MSPSLIAAYGIDRLMVFGLAYRKQHYRQARTQWLRPPMRWHCQSTHSLQIAGSCRLAFDRIGRRVSRAISVVGILEPYNIILIEITSRLDLDQECRDSTWIGKAMLLAERNVSRL